ncbi:hypothetical protein JCM10213_002277 [Rhodosporidiobolus nylandii]
MTAASSSPPPADIFDLLTVGFGPASLAVAIALAEHNSNAPTPAQPTYSALGGLQDALGFDASRAGEVGGDAARQRRPVKACFLEKQGQFSWHSGMQIEGSCMQISFLKDLATLRNPQSAYTFLAYLASFSPSRLVSFISLSTFTPSRREFADYLQWCADKVNGETRQHGGEINYGEEVVAVEALEQAEGDVRVLKVTSRRTSTGETQTRYTRNLVVSTGGSPKMPSQLSSPDLLSSGRVLHTSSFVETIDPILSTIVSTVASSRPIRLAVVGAGQSAAECFLALRSRLASILPEDIEHRPQIDMLFRSSSLRPTDEGPFSNEVFDPAMSQAMFRLPEEHRRRVLAEAKSTNYSIVNPKKLEELYETMYAQKVDEDIAGRTSSSPSSLVRDPRLNLKPFTELVTADLTSSSSVALRLFNPILSEAREVEYDVVVCGTGYDRQAWRHILFPPSTASSAQAETEATASIPLAELFAPTPSSPLATPPALDLPETAFSSLRRPSLSRLQHDESSRSSSRAPSSARDSSASSRHSAQSTAASSPPSPGSPTDKAHPSQAAKDEQQPYKVAENYRLLLPEQTKTGASFKPTVWMQGACEKTHGISDSLLSVLAVRSGEVVQSLLKEGYFGDNEAQKA